MEITKLKDLSIADLNAAYDFAYEEFKDLQITKKELPEQHQALK